MIAIVPKHYQILKGKNYVWKINEEKTYEKKTSKERRTCREK
jgi:hypothetical protein